MATTTDLQPTRAEILAGLPAQYEELAALVAALTPAEWATPSRCEGFDVRDVAGHVIGLAEDVVAGRPGSRTAAEEAASVRDDPPATAAARLTAAVAGMAPLMALLDDDAVWDGPSPVEGMTMAEGILTLWYDAYVHTDDVRAALGRSPARGAGVRAALAYLRQELTKRGYGPVRVVVTDHGGAVLDIGAVDPSTRTVETGAHPFILAATGRLDGTAVGLDAAVNIYAD